MRRGVILPQLVAKSPADDGGSLRRKGVSGHVALPGPAGAVAITGPVTLADFTAGASYGPPAPAHFTEPGPITVTSGTATSLFAGPNYHNVDSILLVVSGAIPSSDVITLTYGSL